MKRKSILLIIAIVAILALVFIGCSKKGESNTNSTNYGFNFDNDSTTTQGGGGSSTGFPPSNVLAEYGFSMIAAPTNVTNVTYAVGSGVLEIYFTVGSGTLRVDSEVENWFASNNWTKNNDLSSNNDSRYYLHYEQDGFSWATYNHDKESGDCQVTIIQ